MLIKYPISREGRAMLNLIMPYHNSKEFAVREFKIDTGADVTTIDKATLRDLEYNDKWIKSNMKTSNIRTLSRAGGPNIPAKCVILPRVIILGKQLINWPFHIREEDSKDFPNLIGLDILSHFCFCMCHIEAVYSLEYTGTPKISIPRDSGEIHELEQLSEITTKLFT